MSNHGSFGIDLANQFSGNTQGEVATFFSTISYQIADQNQGNPQHIGLNIYNDQNGPNISRTRFYGMYSVNVALNDSITVSGGLAIGGISYSIDATTGSVATAGNTAYAPDAKGGIWLKGNRFYLGISLNQALNNQITPSRDPIQIERHFNFTGQQRIPISQNLNLNLSANLRTGPNREEEGFLGINLRVKNKLDAGVSYQVNRAQIIPKIGIFDVNIGNQKLDAMASLRIPAPWSLGFRDLRALGLSASYQFP